MGTTQFEVGANVEIVADLGTPQDGTLFRVIERGRRLHVVQQVSERTGALIGVPVGGCATGDLIEARPNTLREYAATRVRVALAQWDAAVDDDDEDVDTLAELVESAEELADLELSMVRSIPKGRG